MKISIRRAKTEDAVGIFKLCCFMHRETDFKAFQFNPKKCIDSLFAWIDGGLMAIAVVTHDDSTEDIVGMMGASKKNPWFSDDVMVSEDFFFVREDMRGTRAAFKLMREFMAWASEVGAQHVRAGVATGSGPAAERLYQHFGMQYVGGNFSSHL